MGLRLADNRENSNENCRNPREGRCRNCPKLGLQAPKLQQLKLVWIDPRRGNHLRAHSGLFVAPFFPSSRSFRHPDPEPANDQNRGDVDRDSDNNRSQTIKFHPRSLAKRLRQYKIW